MGQSFPGAGPGVNGLRGDGRREWLTPDCRQWSARAPRPGWRRLAVHGL